MTTRGRLAAILDAVRTQLWPIPMIGVLLALVVGVVLPEVDAAIDDSLPAAVSDYLFGGGASAARTVLDAIASSLITVTSLTFSLTVVTLQLASGQFSPRLLRTFTRDRFVHVTLALFLATFVYALTVMRTVRSPDDGQQFVPQISVTVAFALTVASVVALVLFLAHLAREIRVETMLRSVHQDASAATRRLLPDPEKTTVDQSSSAARLPPRESQHGTTAVLAPASGFLVGVDAQAALRAADRCGAVVFIDTLAGTFLTAGTPIGHVYITDPDRWLASINDTTQDTDSTSALTALADRVAGTVSVGTERTDGQDLGLGLRQMVDVAVKALSPGINDPTTAVHALGHIGAFLGELVPRELGPDLARDDHGQIKVVVHRPRFADLLDQAVSQIRRYGASDPAVLEQILRLLRDLGWSLHTNQHTDQRPVTDQHRRADAVTTQIDRVWQTAQNQDFDSQEIDRLRAVTDAARQAVGGRWNPTPP